MCKNTPPTKCTALQSSIRTLDWRTNAGEWYASNAQVKKLKKLTRPLQFVCSPLFLLVFVFLYTFICTYICKCICCCSRISKSSFARAQCAFVSACVCVCVCGQPFAIVAAAPTIYEQRKYSRG